LVFLIKRLDLSCDLFSGYNEYFNIDWIFTCDLQIQLMFNWLLDFYCDLDKEWIHGMFWLICEAKSETYLIFTCENFEEYLRSWN
jgi:hypothetical protein